MREISTALEIDAPTGPVWGILVDFAAYPAWNPFIREIRGKPVAGARLTARMQPPGAPAMTFRPVVTEARPQRELRWLGRLLLPGLFDGEHAFALAPMPDGGTRFVQKERFRGLLVPVLMRRLGKATERGVRGDEPGAEVAGGGKDGGKPARVTC